MPRNERMTSLTPLTGLQHPSQESVNAAVHAMWQDNQSTAQDRRSSLQVNKSKKPCIMLM